jgi:16S rRNA processing protein RimM
MIRRDEISKIGRFRKPHGVHGEITLSFTDDSFDRSDCPFLISPVDGIFVPFRLTEYRFTSDTSAIVSLEGMNTSERVSLLTNLDVYYPQKHLANHDALQDMDGLTGYEMIDAAHGSIGTISDIDTSTVNTLFVITDGQRELLVPAAEEFITGIDSDKRTIHVRLPEGLL